MRGLQPLGRRLQAAFVALSDASGEAKPVTLVVTKTLGRRPCPRDPGPFKGALGRPVNNPVTVPSRRTAVGGNQLPAVRPKHFADKTVLWFHVAVTYQQPRSTPQPFLRPERPHGFGTDPSRPRRGVNVDKTHIPQPKACDLIVMVLTRASSGVLDRSVDQKGDAPAKPIPPPPSLSNLPRGIVRKVTFAPSSFGKTLPLSRRHAHFLQT